MRVIEKKWTDNIYELVIFENPNIRYRLSIYNYANSTIRLARYNKYTMTYKVLFDTKLTKDNYIKAVKITKLLVIKERSKYGT